MATRFLGSTSVANLFGLSVSVLSTVAGFVPAMAALPAGRAWSPAGSLGVPGFSYVAAARLEVDNEGVPLLYAPAFQGQLGDAFGFRWADSTWVTTWKLGSPTIWLWPVQSPAGSSYLVWNGGDAASAGYLFLAKVSGSVVSPAETVAHVADSRTEYSAAVSNRRRWVVVSDQPASYRLRLLYSETANIWQEVQTSPTAQGDEGVAIAALDDTTALVAWSSLDEAGVRWATIRGQTWAEGVPLPEFNPNRPRLRPRAIGGQWIAWGTFQPFVALSAFSAGRWSPPETLRCAYRDGSPQHYSDSPDLSRDSSDPPVVVWAAQDVRARTTVCVCVPTEGVYGVAEELENSETDSAPSVARDANGDVWVAWWKYFETTSWIHSYTVATASAPRVTSGAGGRTVSWTLSEPAPGSWWAVMRAFGQGTPEPVARVSAGSGLGLNWTDPEQHAGVVRYRVRRECIDARYRWESSETQWPVDVQPWPPAGGALLLVRTSANPANAEIRFEVLNAKAGPLSIRVYDVWGRLILNRSTVASGSGRDSLTVNLVSSTANRAAAGLYFLRVVDSAGADSQTTKFVVLR